MSQTHPPLQIVAIVPSISSDRLKVAQPWLDSVDASGMQTVIVTNSRSSAQYARATSQTHLDSGANLGFAKSVNEGAKFVSAWDWIVLLNDDLEFSPGTADAIVAELSKGREPEQGPDIVIFDPGPVRTLPSLREVFASVSLLAEVTSRLKPKASTAPGEESPAGQLASGTYKSFSAVAINKASWVAVGELDEAMPFCYEDADYCRRFAIETGRAPRFVAVGIEHRHSESTKSHIRYVLPVVVFSSRKYLLKIGTSRPIATAVIALALAIRLPLSLLSSAPKGAHANGVVHALGGLSGSKAPKLPGYDRL